MAEPGGVLQPLADPAAKVSLAEGFIALLQRDLTLASRQLGDKLNPVIFFLMVVTMMPLGISPESKALAALAPGLLWVIALLAALLSLDSLFRSDFDDGSLEQLVLSPQPLYFMVIAKVIIHWLTTGLPLTLAAPVLGILLSLPDSGYLPLVLSMLLGTLSLSLIGAIGAALTVSLHKGGLLLSLIIMPLYLPVLIFGASCVRMSVEGNPISAPLAIMGAFCAGSLALAPLAVVGALRMSVESG